MNSRERVIRTIRFEEPDRIPVIHRIKPGAFRLYGTKLKALCTKYPSDIYQSSKTHTWFSFFMAPWDNAKRGQVKDEWGCIWDSLTADHAGQVVGHPLKDWKDLKYYRPPDPYLGAEGVRELEEAMELDKHQHYMLVWAGSIFHRYTYLRDFENALIDIVEEKKDFFKLIDMIVEHVMIRIRRFHQSGIDGILITDDWGTQTSLMINPEIWRRIFKSIYRRLVETIHEGGVFAHFHTCGNTQSILDDLVKIGFDEINPQVPTMNLKDLSHRLRGKICIRPDLGRQGVLCRGGPEDVRNHVIETFQAFKTEKGGFIGHIPVERSVPLKNVEMMMKTFSELNW